MVIHAENLEEVAKYIRHFILVSTTKAGSGHPTSSLSAVELMVALMFGGIFRVDLNNPGHPNNDRLIFSKGHAAPLLYALYAAAGIISKEELMTLRAFGSKFEGHPSMRFPYTEAATGSLGQGLSIGVGMAMNAKIDGFAYRTYVLLGDSEMAEGSNWEALQIGAHYNLDTLAGIIDINRLGQRGETMYGYNLAQYEKKIRAFGWEPIIVERGHNFFDIFRAYKEAMHVKGKPSMIIAKTVKGKGVSFLENKEGWHGKVLHKNDCKKALEELGSIDCNVRGEVKKPFSCGGQSGQPRSDKRIAINLSKPMATRKAYGIALTELISYDDGNKIVVLDAETSNSTYSETVKEHFPLRFFEMFLAGEQNMVGVAVGLSRMGKIPFVSSFGAFLTRAHDQIRMAGYSEANIKFIGSHCGVSIGEDGPSQMALEDISMFRSVYGSTVLYPADSISTYALVRQMAALKGICYLRTTRSETPILYNVGETFPIGGSKTLLRSEKDVLTVVTAGITVYEALKAYHILAEEKIFIRVIDAYSIKPIDHIALKSAASETKAIITVEDHYPEGGLGEAVRAALNDIHVVIYSLAVKKMPMSGSAEELLRYEEIDAGAIVRKVKEIILT